MAANGKTEIVRRRLAVLGRVEGRREGQSRPPPWGLAALGSPEAGIIDFGGPTCNQSGRVSRRRAWEACKLQRRRNVVVAK